MACMPSTPARSGAASSPPCSWTRTNYAWCRCPAAKRRSGLPQVIDELEVERMPGIRRVPLARHHAPGAGVELGEDGIGAFDHRINVGQAQARRQGQRQRIHLRTADHAQLARAIFFGCTRSEAHTSELQSLMRTSYDVFCLKTKKPTKK